MKILQAYKFQLKPTATTEQTFRRFSGCCRFVWNKALALEKETYENEGMRLGYKKLAGLLCEWKKDDQTSFLAEAHSQILQQTLMDLNSAYKNFFAKRAAFPRFKKRGRHDAFRYPQGFKIDAGNSRIFLPKVGWVRYRNSRTIEGTPKQVTVSLSAGKWYASVQTEREVDVPVHPSTSAVGIDMGIARFATLSDGTTIEPLNSFRRHEAKLARLQHRLSRKVKFSNNWRRDVLKLQKQHRKIANVRSDYLHKHTTTISKNHAVVVVEDLQVRNMSRSAAGTVEQPGRSVKAKSRLNKAILDQGWGEFRRQLGYKLSWRGGTLVVVPPQYTSQTCSHCGCVDKGNRRSQAEFVCTACGFAANADYNAALNILAAGYAVTACGAERVQAAAMKQEPARASCLTA